MKRVLVAVACAAMVACGGGGSTTDTQENRSASITGTSTGTVSAASKVADGWLTVTDLDANQGKIEKPFDISAKHGTWGFNTFDKENSQDFRWNYTLDTARLPSSSTSETLTIKSMDGTAVKTIVVTIDCSGGGSSSSTSGGSSSALPAPVVPSCGSFGSTSQ